MTKKQQRRRRRNRQFTQHHLYAVSRYGQNDVTVTLPWWKHKLFHALFGLKNPQEALHDFVSNYLGGEVRHTHGMCVVSLPGLQRSRLAS